MKQQNILMKLVIILLLINSIFLVKWIFEAGSTKVYAQDISKTEIGRYELQYVPTSDGSDPRYILLDTATGVFWEAKGYIENVDNFCIYSESDLKIAKIGNHTVSMHKHK
jgi:hypothetical protein